MSTALPDNWLELAAAHGATQWVKRFIKTYLPQLHSSAIAPQQFAVSLADELDSRGLITPAQQKNYRSNVVQALKVIDENHPAIALVSPTTEEYRVLNEMQRGRLAKRETKYFTSDQAEALVNRAIALLDSAEWSDVGAGLAVLVGRRISEILLSEFSLWSDWSLAFSEMAKKQGAAGLTIEIPTLAPAEKVLGAIQRLQKALRIEDLKLNSLSPKMAKQRVNGRYSGAVAAKCVEGVWQRRRRNVTIKLPNSFTEGVSECTTTSGLLTAVFQEAFSNRDCSHSAWIGFGALCWK